MKELHAQVMGHNVHDWSRSFLDALAAAARSRARGEVDPHSGRMSPQDPGVGDLGLGDLAERVSELARSHSRGVATAESLTAGRISCLLGAASESSAWYRGSIVAYASAVKHTLLEVSPGPVVSADAARQMAGHAAELLGADTVVAVTGAGGPDPQDGQEPGTVWFAVLDRGSVTVEKRIFDASPAGVVESTARHALELLAAACALA